MRIKTILITLLTTLLLFVTCNTDYDGIFMQVSKSEEKTDVGSIVLLKTDGTTFFARTRQHQLQSYNTTTKKWTLIEGAKATHATTTTDGTAIYYAASALGDTNHKIYNLDDGSLHSDQYKIISMAPLYDLMLVKNSDGKFDVRIVSDESKIIKDLEFYSDYTPQLIAMGTDLFVVSGKTESDKYTHYLWDGSLSDPINGLNSPVIAFFKGASKVVFLTSGNKVYSFAAGSGVAGDSVATFSTSSTPASAPYPTFVYNGKLYLQNSSGYLFSIDEEGVVKDADIDLSAVKGWSYIVDDNTVYVGTSENGIYKIDMTTKKVTAL
ncbi:MAG: hypothetical protein PHU15_07930 [Sphaerochaetaceae bacterium]|nr:hypothetical protein [Sphaerochaetaceae bacterium]